MALPSRYGVDKNMSSWAGLSAYENGGKGSGNFGHSGRPGEIGGSGKGSGGEKPEKEKKGSGEISLKGKSLYEKVHMIEPGDEVHITPKDNLPNFDRKIKVDYIQDGTIHYGSSETSDGYTYPAWAIKDITKIIRKKSSYSGEKMMGMPSRYGVDKKINSMAGLSAYENGGPGSGNFGHAGRPGEIGGSSKDGGGVNPNTKIAKDIAKRKEVIEKAKQVTKDIEDRIGQKMKEGETYTALDEAKFSRFKFFHGEDGTEYTYDKIADTITKTNPKTGDQEVVEKSDLVSNEGSNLGVTRKDFETAKQVAKERAGKMSIYEDVNDGLYHAKDNFYDRKFDTKKGVVAFKSGYDDGDKASSFDQLDYTKRQTKSGNSRYDISYKGTDKSYGKSFNNPIEAQYYTEGYNSKIRAIESEVPSEAWKKIKK